jgi:hypothetical protein
MSTTVAPRDAHYQSGGMILTGGKDTLFTVPANFWWDLVLLRVSLGTGAAGSAIVYATLAGTEFILNDAGAFQAGVPYDEEGPLHMEAGDILKIDAGANNHAFYTVSVGSRHPDTGAGSGQAGGFAFGPSWNQ